MASFISVRKPLLERLLYQEHLAGAYHAPGANRYCASVPLWGYCASVPFLGKEEDENAGKGF
jgi:hypothetical protein